MWARHGECVQCGHCCETFARQPIVRDLSTVDDPAFYRARGFADGGVLWAWLLAPCPQHRGDGCAIYAERPATCAAFPTHPRDIVGSPCSYWFTNGGQSAGGLGSPVPTSISAWLAMEGA